MNACTIFNAVVAALYATDTTHTRVPHWMGFPSLLLTIATGVAEAFF